MNIKGILTLKEKNLPIMQNLFIFRDLNELPNNIENIYKTDKNWAIRGFDDRNTIKDSPYKIKDFRFHGFSIDDLPKKFLEINNEMDKANILKNNRIFIICRVYYDKDVEFSGHAYKTGDLILIDVLNGNRPSRRDWTPHISFQIKIQNKIPSLNLDIPLKYKEYIIKICNDIIKFKDKTYLDFTLFKTGYFFYHDLSFH